jgi:hypothetical protein
LVEHPFLEQNSRADDFLAVSVPVKVAETELLLQESATIRMERRSILTRLLLRRLRLKGGDGLGGIGVFCVENGWFFGVVS